MPEIQDNIKKSHYAIRIEDNVKEEMKRRKDIHWPLEITEFIKKKLDEEKRDEENIIIETRNLVQRCKNEDNLDLLKAFYMYSINHEKDFQPLKTNFSLIFKERAKDIEIEMVDEFKKIGVKDRWSRTYQDKPFNELLYEMLEDGGIVDMLEKQIGIAFNEIENKDQIANALWHIGLYTITEYEKKYKVFEDEQMYILFSQIFGVENADDIIRQLNEASIILYDYVNTNAYTHKNYLVPNYSYQLIKDIHENTWKYHLSEKADFKGNIKSILKEEKNRVFLKWMKTFELWFEEVEGSEFIEKFNKDFNRNNEYKAFDRTLNELVKKGLCICWYWPHRSRAGKRKSMAARTYYKLSDEGKKYLSEIIFETITGSTEEKGELEKLIELYEEKINKKS